MNMFKLLKVTLVALTLGSSVLAHSNTALSQEPITLRMKEIPLTKLVEVFSLSQGINLLNWKIVPDTVSVTVDLSSVPADEVFTHILRCGGLSYVQYESGIELVYERHLQGEFICDLHGYGEIERGKLTKL